jgi:hypothetical protein
MPQKTLEWRVKKGKSEGAARMLKATDLAPVNASAHATKKSRYNVLPFEGPDRNVGKRAPPNLGLSKLRKDKGLDHPNALPVTGKRRKQATNELEPHRLQKTTVRGRKKPPSQMHLKRAGGPSKRSPLHGG